MDDVYQPLRKLQETQLQEIQGRPRVVRLSNEEADAINSMSFAEFKEAMAAGRAIRQTGVMQMNVMQQLKELQADRLSLDEKIILAALARTIAAEFTAVGLSVPAWLAEAQRLLSAEIKQQARDAILKEQRELAAQKTQLMTAEQKRELIEQRERELNERLAALA